jgi:competence protein ComGF
VIIRIEIDTTREFSTVEEGDLLYEIEDLIISYPGVEDARARLDD